MDRTVGQVAELTGVSVRTLHHYDEIGLLVPSGRSDAGYRLYDHADLERLQSILFYRELGFALEDIRAALDDPAFDRGAALKRQRELLAGEQHRLARLIDAVDAALAAHDRGETVSDETMFEVFGDAQRELQTEAEERWGDTDAWKESRRRTKGYDEQDWEGVREAQEALDRAYAALFAEGVAADDERAMDAAEAHRRFIDDRFYPCSHQMHVGLGEMYVADQRFTQHYDKHGEGLAAWVHHAIVANATRHGSA